MSEELFEFVKKKSLVFFDFDGVIADSVNIKTEAFYLLYEEYGDEIANRVVEHHLANGGMSRFDKFNHYNKNFLQDYKTKKSNEELSITFSSLVKEKVIESELILGAKEFLDFLLINQILCVIISATPETEMKEILDKKGLSNYFSLVFGSPRSKDQNIYKTLEKLDINTKDCIFFGDATNDLRASIKCGIKFVGVGNHILKEVEDFKLSYYHIDNFLEINKTFKEHERFT
tara:strand:+ start:55 stop:747 length:693 start_codon:yes stop_codon:yes gene_type:complete